MLNVLTDGRPNKGIVDYGVIVDSGAAVTLTNLEVVDSRRIVDNSIKVVEPPVIIQGVGGKPVKCTSSCSMYVYYTDSEGEPHKFILDNCYICNVVRTPLVSATHLVSKGCVIRLASTGHIITFPDNTESILETLTSGLIALLPNPSNRPKSNDETKGICQITIAEENDPMHIPSTLETTQVTTLDPRDIYEFEVGVDEELPEMVTEDESEDESEDSDGETFVPKEGNRNQVTGSEPIVMRDVSSINLTLRGISEGPLQRRAMVRKCAAEPNQNVSHTPPD